MQSATQMDISVVIPVHNEEENIPILQSLLKQVLDKTGKNYEIIFVDDCSTDNTFHVLEDLYKFHPEVRVIKFRSNFGQSAAMAAGFEAARGDVVISMDGDLQNDPADIPRILQKLNEGYDVVSGWRKNRKDKLIIRKIPSKIANKLICSVTGIKLHDTGCSLKSYRKEVIKKIHLYGELHRFIPALAKLEGARIAEIAVGHHARRFGRSKYNLSRTFKVLMDLTTLNLFLKYFKNPLHFFGLIGFGWIFSASVLGGYLLVKAFQSSLPVEKANVLITLLFLLLVVGVQFLFFGLLAALIASTGEKRNIYASEVTTNGE
jgi:glycosyltransferase involved in cell wall biosynthesis